jgi:hypothetical protein
MVAGGSRSSDARGTLPSRALLTSAKARRSQAARSTTPRPNRRLLDGLTANPTANRFGPSALGLTTPELLCGARWLVLTKQPLLVKEVHGRALARADAAPLRGSTAWPPSAGGSRFDRRKQLVVFDGGVEAW